MSSERKGEKNRVVAFFAITRKIRGVQQAGRRIVAELFPKRKQFITGALAATGGDWV